MKIEEKYIKRCLQLAQNGFGTTYPNPLVGSVIVYNDRIIGEGWHQKSGGPHAEVNAINAVKDPSLLPFSTIYVSLEPCSHFGKTPPCADLIIAKKIPNVVIGTLDPHAKVAGNGIKKLLENNINVKIGFLETECHELNKRFFTFQQKKRPYIILKWAQTKDGFIAPKSKDINQPVWISNEYSRQLVHQWRSEEQAILVGFQTVVDDNPSLTTRDWAGNNPIRVVLDKNNSISKDFAIFDNQSKTLVFSEPFNDNNEIWTNKIADFLFQNDIQSIIIEGGKTTIQRFIDANLWDEARVFIGTAVFKEGLSAPLISNKPFHRTNILDDELLIYNNHD